MPARHSFWLVLSVAFLSIIPANAADLPPGALIRLGESRFRHGANPTSVAYSSDGKMIATVDEARNVVVWDVAMGQPIQSWNPNNRNAGRLRFSPDGSRLAAVDSYNRIHIWEIATGKHLEDETGWSFRSDCIDWMP